MLKFLFPLLSEESEDEKVFISLSPRPHHTTAVCLLGKKMFQRLPKRREKFTSQFSQM